MLSNLAIKNYALIDHLDIAFQGGYNVITGETGAGKSILLGGLSLVLGKRADLSSLRIKDQKCVIEAQFAVKNYNLKSFFTENDLDYEDVTIVRREILPSGKSRAFINDSPVTLSVLSELGSKLIDVHSQHQTLQLTENDFQLRVIDALADNSSNLGVYKTKLKAYQTAQRELTQLIDLQSNASKEQDYNSFLLKELEAAPLQIGIIEELEEQYGQLNNMESILEQLSKGNQLLNDEQVGVINLLSELKQTSQKLASFGANFISLDERIQSVLLETEDISSELYTSLENMETNPQLLNEVNAKLQLLHDLQKKHQSQNIEELIAVRDKLSKEVAFIENSEEAIAEKELQVQVIQNELTKIAAKINGERKKVLPSLKKQLEEELMLLGMENATFSIEISSSEEFKASGKDNLAFLFSANKGSAYGELKKVASGGELSRIMLTIKAILAKYDHLPTMMFDEIDTGVSGEISNRMGSIMNAMGNTMQVFSITHLPQVASKGGAHYKVYKEDVAGRTITKIKELSNDERIVELAEMLGGKAITDSAMAHARQLLN